MPYSFSIMKSFCVGWREKGMDGLYRAIKLHIYIYIYNFPWYPPDNSQVSQKKNSGRLFKNVIRGVFYPLVGATCKNTKRKLQRFLELGLCGEQVGGVSWRWITWWSWSQLRDMYLHIYNTIGAHVWPCCYLALSLHPFFIGYAYLQHE